MENMILKNNIAIAGLTAAGKTTHSRISSEEFGLEYFSASNLLRDRGGCSADYPPDFWTSLEGMNLVKKVADLDIDEALIDAEDTKNNTIFDCRSLPWLSRNKILSIWLDSSLESRVDKALISYEGKVSKNRNEIYKLVKSKDDQDRITFKRKFDFDMFSDYYAMDVVLDITVFTRDVSIQASWRSIQESQDIISMIIGLYLTGDTLYRHRLREMRNQMGEVVFRRFSPYFKNILDS